MTKEEALNILHNASVYHPDYLDALNMAIKALEKEPKSDTWSIKDVADTLAKHGLIAEQEPCEDAVSRKEVLNQIFYSTDNTGDVVLGSALWERIERMPSVTPQEPTTKNDLGVDVVNRKELLKIYEYRFLELQKLKHLKDNKGLEDRKLGVNYCINILKELPSVNPQKIGHWIIEKWNNKEHYSCSICQHVVDYEPCYHYCPYCGAKMSEIPTGSESEVEE